jgi:hypothetical protein
MHFSATISKLIVKKIWLYLNLTWLRNIFIKDAQIIGSTLSTTFFLFSIFSFFPQNEALNILHFKSCRNFHDNLFANFWGFFSDCFKMVIFQNKVYIYIYIYIYTIIFEILYFTSTTSFNFENNRAIVYFCCYAYLYFCFMYFNRNHFHFYLIHISALNLINCISYETATLKRKYHSV